MTEFIIVGIVFAWLFGYTFNIWLLEFDEDESIGSFIVLFFIWPIFDILVIIIIICCLINELIRNYKKKQNDE
jgi:uncharacterized membrane protein